MRGGPSDGPLRRCGWFSRLTSSALEVARWAQPPSRSPASERGVDPGAASALGGSVCVGDEVAFASPACRFSATAPDCRERVNVLQSVLARFDSRRLHNAINCPGSWLPCSGWKRAGAFDLDETNADGRPRSARDFPRAVPSSWKARETDRIAERCDPDAKRSAASPCRPSRDAYPRSADRIARRSSPPVARRRPAPLRASGQARHSRLVSTA